MCLLAWATMTGPTKYLWLENLLYLSCVCLIGMIIVFVLVISLLLTWTHCCHSWSWVGHKLGKGRCLWRRESFQTERWNFLLTGLSACPRRPPPHCECSIAFSRTRCTTASQQRPPLQTVSRPPWNTNKTIKCHLHQTLGFLLEKYPSSCKLRSWKTADSTRTVFSLSDMLLRCPTLSTTVDNHLKFMSLYYKSLTRLKAVRIDPGSKGSPPWEPSNPDTSSIASLGYIFF